MNGIYPSLNKQLFYLPLSLESIKISLETNKEHPDGKLKTHGKSCNRKSDTLDSQHSKECLVLGPTCCVSVSHGLSHKISIAIHIRTSIKSSAKYLGKNSKHKN